MSADLNDKLTEIFWTASTLSPDERAAYLDRACAGDAALREEVESLLAFDERQEEPLSEEAMGRHIRSLLEDSLGADGRPAQPDRIGPYEILGVLGEGGQGIVFKAEQETPRRIVALKVLRAGSFATQHDLRRFRKEIQALALLRHPTIATIHDGGHTDEGQHFFALEFVDGAPINTYVRESSLSLDARLELFRAVCDGVHYAHEKGVIHRDLKPTNILVDAEGNPKILDFGLVRITNAELSTASADSKTGFVVGSFGYMSPEQACGKHEEISARTDVYSLGVILYELLTGRRPYETGPSLPDAVRTICEVRPPPPSSFDRGLPRDLDTIVSTALEKEPSRRYGSVAELADDLHRFLHGEPIHARPPSLAYFLGKKIRKYRVALALLAVLAVVGTAWVGQRFRANQRELFQARYLAVELQSVLERAPAGRVVGPARSLAEKHPNLPVAALVAAQAGFRAGVPHAPMVHLRRGIARGRQAWAYRLLRARIQRGTDPQLAGQLEEQALREFPDTAEAWHLRSFATLDLQEAIECAKAAIERDPGHLLASTRQAYLCEQVGDYGCAREAVDRLMELDRSGSQRFMWQRFHAMLFMKQGMFREAIEAYDSLGALDPAWQRGLYTDRALAHLCTGDHERAVADYTRIIESGHYNTSWVYRWRATPLWILGRLEEASEDYESFRRMESGVSYADARLFLLRHERARSLESQGRSADAAELLEQAGVDLEAARRGVEQGSWLQEILDTLAGERSPEQLIRVADPSSQEQVCEAYYYGAEVSLLAGRTDEAREWFQDCVDTGLLFDPNELADPMSEYHLALWRVSQLGSEP